MNEQKSLIHHLAEAYERYRAERNAAAPEQAPPPTAKRHDRLHWLGRQLMPNVGTLVLVVVLLLTQNAWARPLLNPAAPGPSATTVNYQGRLANSGGTPLTGTYGMSFALYDAASGGNLVWGPEEHSAVPVSNGLFSVGLGSKTSSGIPTTTWNGDRYLEIAVGGETLAPRELIRSVPIAGMALTVPDGAIGINQLASDTFLQAIQNPEIHWTASVIMDGATYKPFPDFAASAIVTRASKILIVASAPIEITGSFGYLYAGFQRNGVQMPQTHRFAPNGISGGVWSWNYVDTVSPGTYTYRLEAKGTNGMSVRWYRPSVSLIVMPVMD